MKYSSISFINLIFLRLFMGYFLKLNFMFLLYFYSTIPLTIKFVFGIQFNF